MAGEAEPFCLAYFLQGLWHGGTEDWSVDGPSRTDEDAAAGKFAVQPELRRACVFAGGARRPAIRQQLCSPVSRRTTRAGIGISCLEREALAEPSELCSDVSWGKLEAVCHRNAASRNSGAGSFGGLRMPRLRARHRRRSRAQSTYALCAARSVCTTRN